MTNENINRINDILLELQNQLEPLHEQKVKAETFLKLQEEKKRIDITIYCHDIEELFKKLNNFKADYNAIEKNVLGLKTEIESKKNTLYEAELELESFKKQLDRKKTRLL